VEQAQESNPSRRHVVTVGAAAAVGAVGVTGLAGCGGSSSGAGTDLGAGAGAGAVAPNPLPTSPPASSVDANRAPSTLAKVSEVPVGSGVVVQASDGASVVVSQPTKGKIVAFSATCTHMGCIVGVAENMLVCPCHGSTYDLATGKNLSGPAPLPLPKIPITVKGGTISTK